MLSSIPAKYWYDSTVVPLLAYAEAEHLELWDNLLPAYADGTLAGLTR